MLRIDRDVVPTMAKTPDAGDVGARSAPHRSSTSFGSATSST